MDEKKAPVTEMANGAMNMYSKECCRRCPTESGRDGYSGNRKWLV